MSHDHDEFCTGGCSELPEHLQQQIECELQDLRENPGKMPFGGEFLRGEWVGDTWVKHRADQGDWVRGEWVPHGSGRKPPKLPPAPKKPQAKPPKRPAPAPPGGRDGGRRTALDKDKKPIGTVVLPSTSKQWLDPGEIRAEIDRCLKQHKVPTSTVGPVNVRPLRGNVAGWTRGPWMRSTGKLVLPITIEFNSLAWSGVLPSDRLETIRHETAHAINLATASPYEMPPPGHGNRWREIALSVGSTGEATVKLEEAARFEAAMAASGVKPRGRRARPVGSGLTEDDFKVGDNVEFKAKGMKWYGIITSKGPVRAKVKSQGREWGVPYGMLSKSSVEKQLASGGRRNPADADADDIVDYVVPNLSDGDDDDIVDYVVPNPDDGDVVSNPAMSWLESVAKKPRDQRLAIVGTLNYRDSYKIIMANDRNADLDGATLNEMHQIILGWVNEIAADPAYRNPGDPVDPSYKFFVVDVNTVSIDSGWEYREDAIERAAALKEEGGVPKICNRNRVAVGTHALPPDEESSWVPVRNARENPAQLVRVPACPDCGRRRGAEHKADCRLTGRRRNPGDNAHTDVRSPTSTSTEVRSPTSTSTEVRSPTSTSTDAYTAGNVTVTGGAGAGATTSVSITSPGPRSKNARNEHQEWRDGRNGVARATDRSQRDDRVTQQDVHALTRGRGRQEFADAPRGEHEPDFGDHRGGRANPRLNPHEDLEENHGTQRAIKTFSMWHEKEAKNVGVVRLSNNDDAEMVCVGTAMEIQYRSGKWERGNKTNDYYHVFDTHPKVWMLASKVSDADIVGTARKTAGQLLRGARGADGRFAVAELSRPLSLTLDGDTNDGDDITIHKGGKVYGAVDHKTVVIVDSVHGLIVIKGGKMSFDERGIVN